MKGFFILFLFTIPVISKAQVFAKGNSGLSLYSDTSFQKLIGTDTYEACYCDIPYLDSDSTQFNYLKPKGNRAWIGVKKNGAWGVIDKSGKTIIDFAYDHPVIPMKGTMTGHLKNMREQDQAVFVQPKTTLTLLDTGDFNPEEYIVQDEHEGYLLVTQDEEYYGIMNPELKVILPLKYRSLIYTKERFYFNPNGLLTLKTSLDSDKKCGMVNYKGEVLFPFKYDFISDYIANENAIFVQINDNRGFVDSKGNVKLPMRFKLLPYELTDTMLIADEHYTWFINMDYSVVGDKKYQAMDKKDSLYFFKRNGKWGIMDENLNVFVPNVYESISDAPRIPSNPEFKAYVVVKDQKYGVISLKGEVIIPCKYECMCTLGYFSPEGIFIEFKNGTTAYKFDEIGKLLEQGPSKNDRCLCEIY